MPRSLALRLAALVICLLLPLGLTGCVARLIRPTTERRVEATPALVQRGSYLVNQVSACGLCHTPRVGSNWLGAERADGFLAGGPVFDIPDEGFRVVVPNITQDKETGIGSWTDDQILRAVRDGVSRDGRLLMPPMPFASWKAMSDDDARAIVAYLRTVPAVRNAVSREGNRIPFLLRIGTALGLIHHEPATGVKAPERADKRAYGAYLTKLGLCWECHSLGKGGPSDGEDDLMAGSGRALFEPEFGRVHARNLTPDPETGLGRYTADQIKRALRTGRRLDGRPMGPPMSLVVPHVSHWDEDDLDALATYLTSLRPIRHQVPERELVYASCDSPPQSALDALPRHLSQTGLYEGPVGGPIARTARPFRPQFELWSDGSTKRRWISLPPGTRIDSSDMDSWRFPQGTKLWKEFRRDGVPVETRLLQKIGPRDEDWAAVAYLWNGDGSEATAVPSGVSHARGTEHDVPSAAECMACHAGRRSRVLGFSAVQLADRAEAEHLDLAAVVALGWLSSPPSVAIEVPGTVVERSALGYLHSNCGHCHNQARPVRAGSKCYDPYNSLDFWLRVDRLATPTETPTYRSAVGNVIQPGHPSWSRLLELVGHRAPGRQMPPLATKMVDERALHTLRSWIETMPPEASR
jgi:mono/diheme cytochrome c family protein